MSGAAGAALTGSSMPNPSTPDPKSKPAVVTTSEDEASPPPDAQRQASRHRGFVRLHDRRLACKDGTRVQELRGHVRCRPAAAAIPFFLSPPGELEFVNHFWGKRHAAVYFSEAATDCDVEQALCAVNGDLVTFGPQARNGIVLFPWVGNDQDLDAAMRLRERQVGVHAVTRDFEAQRH